MSSAREFDVTAVRSDFPILSYRPHIYLDNAATTHKPESVIRSITDFYRLHNANVHRGVYRIGSEATQLYEGTRSTVARFIGASPEEIVFTYGSTDGINQVAVGLVSNLLSESDNIVCLASEHHANLVPWQEVTRRRGAELKILHLDESLDLNLESAKDLIDEHTCLVAIAHTSNVTGARYPIEDVIKHAHQMGALVLVDAAQALMHESVDVHRMGADFLVFSGHKLLGPSGCGVLYGKADLLSQMQPSRFGGDMIRRVSYTVSTYTDAPGKFEAGTPPISAVIGLGAAIEYINQFNMTEISSHNATLTEAAESILKSQGFTILGRPKKRGPILSFTHPQMHPHDLASILDERDIAIRAGHHCAQPFLHHLGVLATARASFSLYNTLSEVDSLGAAVYHAKKVLL